MLHVKNFVICDREQLYAKNLFQLLANKKAGYQMYLFHTMEELLAFSQQKRIDVLLIDENYCRDEREQVPAGEKYVLVREMEDDMLSENERGVYRYQSADQIWGQVLKREAERVKLPAFPEEKTGEELIGIYSPVRRIGKTKFALELGKKLAEKESVLYLNLEEYSGGGYYFQSQKGGDLSDLLYYARQERGDLGLRISMMAQQEGKLDYIAPMAYVQDLQAVSYEEWKTLFEKIFAQCIYTKIILDLGDSIRGLFQILQDCSVVYTPYIEEPSAHAKLNQYVENLRKIGLESVLEKTVQRKMRSRVVKSAKQHEKED